MHHHLWSLPALADADAYILPSHDAFRSEMPPAANQRLGAATGFTGSAGTAVFTRDKNGVLLTDGRYLLQAEQEIDRDYFTVINSGETPLPAVLTERLTAGAVIAYDPMVWSVNDIQKLIAAAPGYVFSPCKENPVDALWQDRPALALAVPETHPLSVAGESTTEKLTRIAAHLQHTGADALVESRSEAVCWLFNVRGFDMPCTPALFSRALIRADGGALWFLHEAGRTPEALRESLRAHGVEIQDEIRCPEALRALPAGATVSADMACFPSDYEDALSHLTVTDAPSVITGMQAVKHPAELHSITDGHIHDGAAVTRFLFALERDLRAGIYKSECELADMLRDYRKQAPGYIRDSFDTISGIDGNGAIIHYRPHPGKDARVTAHSRTLLIDSGGQYPGATTDITRTIALPGVQQDEKYLYTRVCQGHIALARAVFPQGVTGGELDVLARSPLWREGNDYAHGTGHGVGCFMGVHEGPHRIGRRSQTPLHAGMIVSNEPGYYRQDAFGIRIENLMAVEQQTTNNGVSYLGFRTLTLAPMDIHMLAPELLSPDEKQWLLMYHRRIEETLASLLPAEDAATLAALTKRYEAL